MEDNRKYIFVGDRANVLKEMLRLGLCIEKTYVINGSFLHHMLIKEPFISYEVIYSKQQLLEALNISNYDVLISNGCKYILPISSLKEATYINIHPSYLPDLKGKSPINGAFLYTRDGGATCHIMDNGIDSGSIIARTKIPMTNDIDAALLYQLSFKAEAETFKTAYERNFIPLEEQPFLQDPIYYSAVEDDLYVKFDKGFDFVLHQAKAFGYKNKGLYFTCNHKAYHFYAANELLNPYVLKCCEPLIDLQVAFVFENSIVFKFENRIMRFDQIDSPISNINEGDLLSKISLCPNY